MLPEKEPPREVARQEDSIFSPAGSHGFVARRRSRVRFNKKRLSLFLESAAFRFSQELPNCCPSLQGIFRCASLQNMFQLSFSIYLDKRPLSLTLSPQLLPLSLLSTPPSYHPSYDLSLLSTPPSYHPLSPSYQPLPLITPLTTSPSYQPPPPPINPSLPPINPSPPPIKPSLLSPPLPSINPQPPPISPLSPSTLLPAISPHSSSYQSPDPSYQSPLFLLSTPLPPFNPTPPINASFLSSPLNSTMTCVTDQTNVCF